MRYAILFIYLVSVNSVFAQSGYEAIKKNDFFEAKKTFESTLQNDSLNFDGLTGMVLLSELSQSSIEYDNYLNVLFRHVKDPFMFALFNTHYQGDFSSLETLNYPDWITIKYKLEDAISWGAKNRDRPKLWEKYNRIIPKVNWSVIGPFKNINGSGFDIAQPIESEHYLATKTYKNHDGVRLNWVTPLYSASSGRIVFSQHLPDVGMSSDAVYYANSFISCTEDKSIHIHIGRSAGIKLWVNDVLVYETNHTVPFTYDLETVALHLKKGNNRILIKNSTQKNREEYDGSLKFKDDITYEHDMLAIRFTETDGKPILNLVSPVAVEIYNKGIDSFKTTNYSLVDYFKEKSAKTDNIWLDYCLLKAFISENKSKAGEDFFWQKSKLNPDIIFYKYVLAKLCQLNGKTEKVYELLSKGDEFKSPFFGLQYEKLQEINLETEPDAYFIALNKLTNISPSNLNTLNRYIDYFNKMGMQIEKDTFIYQSIRKFPLYKSDLEPSLSKYKEFEERYGPAEEIKVQKQSIKALKSGSHDYDFNNAIDYYKDRKKEDKVIAIYKDKIYFAPHLCASYYEFGSYLKEIGKYKEAEVILKTSLEINPYQSGVYELLGDIAILEADELKALSFFNKGKALGSGMGIFGYASGINDKIEQISGHINYKDYFKTPTFNETLTNPDWLKLAENEDAIILQYTKDCLLDTTNLVTISQSLMIKIIKESGIEKYSEMDMGFMGDLTSVKVIKTDGIELNPEKSGNYLVIKNLEVGDLIQVEGHVSLPAETVFGKEFFHQHFIFFPSPVFFSKFECIVPKGKFLGYKTHKLDKEPTRFTDSFDNDHYIWQNTNLEKIEEESAIPDYYDLYRSISISTIKNWQSINEWYEQTTYQKTELTYEVKHVLDTLLQGTVSDYEKVQKIYNYVTSKIRYSYVPFLNTQFIPKWSGNTVSAGIGDCKDVATLMITMLKSQGIEAYYTLVKSKHFNRLDPVPSLAFDHVIVCYILNGKKKYCDLTTNFYPLYVLPEMDNDAIGLLIKPGEYEIFNLPNDLLDTAKTVAKYEIDAELTLDRTLQLSIKAEYTGIAGGNLREQIFRTPENKYSDFISNYFGQDVFENGIYNRVDFMNLNDFSNPLNARIEIKAIGFADKVSGMYILRMPYLEGIKKSNVLLEKNRTNRVDLEKVLNIYSSEQTINLKIPLGYKLVEIPSAIFHRSAFSSYSVQFKKDGQNIQIIKRQHFLKSIIEINEFDLFKADYLKLSELDKFKIAIVKM